MSRVSGAVALLEAVAAHGVDTIFGLPGGQLDHFFDAIYGAGDRVRLIGSRHEQGAAYMAFGYARSTGRVGTYCVVPGPGVLNTTAALCTAYACNAPVLCLTGQIPSEAIGRGRGELHELPDQLATLRTLTKWAARIDHPAQVEELVARAFRELTGGSPSTGFAGNADGHHGATNRRGSASERQPQASRYSRISMNSSAPLGSLRMRSSR